METFDVVVVGGRVAGSPVAMLLARQGHKVLLLEKQMFPKDVLSTHFIWARGVSYLNRWGLAERVLANTPHGTRMELNLEGVSLQGSVPLDHLQRRFQSLHGDGSLVTDTWCGPRRYLIDEILLDAAKEAGVDVREGYSFTSPIVENGIVTGVHVSGPAGVTLTVKTKLLIGADGRFSEVAKKVEAKPLTVRERSSFAYWGYFEHPEKDKQAIFRRGRFGAALFPTSDGTHMALVYGPNAWWDDFRKEGAANFFRVFDFCSPGSEEVLRTAKQHETFKACGTMPAFLKQSHGPGWALIGDAGAFHDQVTAMGMTHAFRDADLMASFIHKSLSGQMPMDKALAEYTKVREADHNEYFELVCTSAEMNVFSKSEVGFFHDIRNDQKQVNQLLSHFGDTQKLAAGDSFSGPADPGSAAFVEQFEAQRPAYEANLFRKTPALA